MLDTACIMVISLTSLRDLFHACTIHIGLMQMTTRNISNCLITAKWMQALSEHQLKLCWWWRLMQTTTDSLLTPVGLQIRNVNGLWILLEAIWIIVHRFWIELTIIPNWLDKYKSDGNYWWYFSKLAGITMLTWCFSSRGERSWRVSPSSQRS